MNEYFVVKYNHKNDSYFVEPSDPKDDRFSAPIKSCVFDSEEEAILFGGLVLNTKNPDANELFQLVKFVLRMCGNLESNWSKLPKPRKL